MPRGVKPSPKALPRSPLTDRVPAGLSGVASKVYKQLAKELATEGYACQADWRTVSLTASTQAHVDRLRAEVEALEELTVYTKGGAKIHPLVTELRAACAQLAALYAQLLLTPRSRSASRMTEQQSRSAASKSDSLEDFLGE